MTSRTVMILMVMCLLLGAPPLARGDVTFFVAPNEYPVADSTLDEDWRAAVFPAPIWEFDLDDYPSGFDLDSLTAWPGWTSELTIDVGLATPGPGGSTANTAEIFWGSFGGSAGGEYGTVFGGALLNRDSSGATYSDITFSFSGPVVGGFGAWVFDNNASSSESFCMIVTEVGGATFTSSDYVDGVLESDNNDHGNPHFVEGWLGVTSTVGITDVAIRQLDANGDPVADRCFELDHIQVIPAPSALLLCLIGVGTVLGYRRFRP